MKFEIAARTEVGAVRNHNEDNYLVNPDLSQNDWFYTNNLLYNPGKKGSLLIVADGMGGMNAGEVAARIAVESIKEHFEQLDNIPVEEVQDSMKKAIIYANEKIIAYSKENPETENMGTTLVVAWLRDDLVHICWVGDSRAYLLREGEKLRPISLDHSLVQQWVNEGKITEEEAFYHPQNNIVTQSLGDSGKIPAPDYERHKLKDGDKILLCSDGLNNMLQDEEIEEILRSEQTDLKSIAEKLANAAIKAGGHDNITLVLAGIKEAEGTLASISARDSSMGVSSSFQRIRNVSILFALLLIVAAFFIFPSKEKSPDQKSQKKNVKGKIVNPNPPPGNKDQRLPHTPGDKANPNARTQKGQDKGDHAKKSTGDGTGTAANTASQIVPVLDEEKGLWGYKRTIEDEKWIIKPRFTEANSFWGETTTVVENGVTYILDKKGNTEKIE